MTAKKRRRKNCQVRRLTTGGMLILRPLVVWRT